MLNSKLQEYLKSFPADFEILVDGHTDFAMQVSYFIKGGTVSGRILIADGKSDVSGCELQDSDKELQKKNNIESAGNKTCVESGQNRDMSLTAESDFTFLENATRKQKGNFYRQYADVMDVDLKTLTKKSFMAKWHCESNTYYRCKERIGKFLSEKNKIDNSKSNQAETTANAAKQYSDNDKEPAKKSNGRNNYSTKEKINIVKEVLSIPNRTHKDVIRIAEKYGLHKRSLYGYMSQYAKETGLSYIRNGFRHFKKNVNQDKKSTLASDKKGETKTDSENKKKFSSPATIVSDEDRLKIAADIKLGLFSFQILKKYHINIKTYSEIKKFVEAEKKKSDTGEDSLKDVKKRLKYGRSLNNNSSILTIDNSGLDEKVAKKDDKTDTPKAAINNNKPISIQQKNKKFEYPVDKGAMTEEERDRFTRDLISRGF